MPAVLPPELWHLIFLHVRQRDIHSLRLVSRTIKEIAEDHMFSTEDLQCYLRRADMDMMLAIAERNPVLAKGFRTLEINTDRLLPVRDREDWDEMRRLTTLSEAVEQNQMNSPPDHYSEDSDDARIKAKWKPLRESTAALLQRETARHSSHELDTAYSWYLNEAEFQVTLLRQGAIHKFLYRLFKACPSIGNSVSIVLPLEGRSGPTLQWQPTVYNRYLATGLISAWGTPSLHSNDQILTQTLLAAADTKTTIVQLNVDPVSHHFFRQHEPVMHRIYQAIRTTASITLRLQGEFDVYGLRMLIPHGEEDFVAATLFPQPVTDENDEAHIVRNFNRGGVADFLAHATDLRVLRVLCPGTYLKDSWMSLNAIVPERLWPKLQYISLFGFQCTEEEFVRFVAKCCVTVVEFYVKCPLLTRGRWTSCFRRVAGMFRSVKRFGFDGALSTRTADGGRVARVDMPNAFERGCLYDFLRTAGPVPDVIIRGYFDP